jgi:threonine dehydrogenase-like Zn-dependent dehydrogenase
MLALRFHPGENDFILEDNIPIPTIEKDDDVIIKVEYAGLCGTDLHIVQVSILIWSIT